MITARAGVASLTDIEFGRQVTAHFHTDLLLINLRLAPGFFHVWLPSSSSLPNVFRRCSLATHLAGLVARLSLVLSCLSSAPLFARSSFSSCFVALVSFLLFLRRRAIFGVALLRSGTRGSVPVRPFRSIRQTEVESNGICQISA